MNMKIVAIIGMVCVLLAIVGLNRVIAFYEKKTAHRWEEYFDELDLISPEISYSKYKEIAERASVPNTPTRTEGDFWDFLMPYEKESDTGYIEDRLSYAGCGGDDR